jgi:hypothetical protein
MNLNQSLAAGEAVDIKDTGNYFRYMSGSATLDLIFYRNGKSISESIGVTQGYAERFNSESFDALKIINRSGTAQTIVCLTRNGNDVFFDRPPTGSVTITNTAGAFVQTAPAVGNTSGALVAAKSNRRYLLIVNQHATESIHLEMDGTTAVIGSSLILGPGDSFSMENFCTTSAVNAIAVNAIAANGGIVVLEG